MRVDMNAGISIGSFSEDVEDDEDREKTATRLLARGSTWIWNDDKDDDEDETVSTSGSWCRESSRERSTYRWRDDVQQKHSNTNGRRARACSVCLVWPFGDEVHLGYFSPPSLFLSFFLSLVRSFFLASRSMSILERCVCVYIRTRQHFTEFLLSLSFFSFLTQFLPVHSLIRQLKEICTRPSTVDTVRG